jgi:predicted regulator of Ras-like GTPase activity (Roadblock/LC7/MglB family)
VTIIGEDGILAISSVNEHFALVSQLDDGANLGLIRRLMNEGTSHLRPLMS